MNRELIHIDKETKDLIARLGRDGYYDDSEIIEVDNGFLLPLEQDILEALDKAKETLDLSTYNDVIKSLAKQKLDEISNI